MLAARQARSGHRRSAKWLGVLGAVIAADLGVIMAINVWQTELSPWSAPLWLPTALTGSGLGILDESGMDVFTVLDLAAIVPDL